MDLNQLWNITHPRHIADDRHPIHNAGGVACKLSHDLNMVYRFFIAWHVHLSKVKLCIILKILFVKWESSMLCSWYVYTHPACTHFLGSGSKRWEISIVLSMPWSYAAWRKCYGGWLQCQLKNSAKTRQPIYRSSGNRWSRWNTAQRKIKIIPKDVSDLVCQKDIKIALKEVRGQNKIKHYQALRVALVKSTRISHTTSSARHVD